MPKAFASAHSGGSMRFCTQMGGVVTRLSWRKCQKVAPSEPGWRAGMASRDGEPGWRAGMADHRPTGVGRGELQMLTGQGAQPVEVGRGELQMLTGQRAQPVEVLADGEHNRAHLRHCGPG